MVECDRWVEIVERRASVNGGLPVYRHRGLTLLELIVVLAIISVLLGLLLPAVQSARERAREAVCKNNVHQINIAVGHYVHVHKQVPPPSLPGRTGGWIVGILPFIEQQNLKDVIEVGLPIVDVPAALFVPPPIFRCPRRTVLDGESGNGMSPGHYVLMPGSGRKTFSVSDAPVDLSVPWIGGPEMGYQAAMRSKGPHHDGFFVGSGFQQGVDFMLNGRRMH